MPVAVSYPCFRVEAPDVHGLALTARKEGAGASSLRARIDHNIVPADSARFNLTVRDIATGKMEIFRNLSWRPEDARRVDVVLARESRLVDARLPAARPGAHAHLNPAASPPRIDLWADNTPATSSRLHAVR